MKHRVSVCSSERRECDEGFRGMQHTEEVFWPAALPPEPRAHGNKPGGRRTHLMVKKKKKKHTLVLTHTCPFAD